MRSYNHSSTVAGCKHAISISRKWLCRLSESHDFSPSTGARLIYSFDCISYLKKKEKRGGGHSVCSLFFFCFRIGLSASSCANSFRNCWLLRPPPPPPSPPTAYLTVKENGASDKQAEALMGPLSSPAFVIRTCLWHHINEDKRRLRWVQPGPSPAEGLRGCGATGGGRMSESKTPVKTAER